MRLDRVLGADSEKWTTLNFGNLARASRNSPVAHAHTTRTRKPPRHPRPWPSRPLCWRGVPAAGIARGRPDSRAAAQGGPGDCRRGRALDKEGRFEGLVGGGGGWYRGISRSDTRARVGPGISSEFRRVTRSTFRVSIRGPPGGFRTSSHSGDVARPENFGGNVSRAEGVLPKAREERGTCRARRAGGGGVNWLGLAGERMRTGPTGGPNLPMAACRARQQAQPSRRDRDPSYPRSWGAVRGRAGAEGRQTACGSWAPRAAWLGLVHSAGREGEAGLDG